MAMNRLECPDCGTVLRPAKPVAAGKKVKCPNCELIFVVGEDDEDDAPRKKSAKPKKTAVQTKPGAKKAEAPPKQEEEIYGYFKDEDEDEEDKPEIEYAPDDSIRDLRGPAIVKLTGPANRLQLIGMAGVIGWLVLFVLLLIPTVFPVTPGAGDKSSPVSTIGPGLGAVDPGPGAGGFAGFGAAPKSGEKKMKEEDPGFFEFFGLDLGVWFLLLMVPMILGGIYSAMVVAGGINAQNLESRAWGITGSIMAMLPMHVLGLAVVTSLVANYLVTAILEDADFGRMISMVLMGIEYFISLILGGMCLKTLFDPDVIDGFEFDPD